MIFTVMQRRLWIMDRLLITRVGRVWVLPHPERTSPRLARTVTDPENERIAVQHSIRHEEARGLVVEVEHYLIPAAALMKGTS